MKLVKGCQRNTKEMSKREAGGFNSRCEAMSPMALEMVHEIVFATESRFAEADEPILSTVLFGEKHMPTEI